LPLQRLEVKIPVKGKCKFSTGTACEVGDLVKWDIPVSKLKSKAAEIEIENILGSQSKLKADVRFII
jgi:hypothetical protein